jgi:hypothetical protein
MMKKVLVELRSVRGRKPALRGQTEEGGVTEKLIFPEWNGVVSGPFISRD